MSKEKEDFVKTVDKVLKGKKKKFMYVIENRRAQYRYIEAYSEAHAQEMWDEDTWEDAEYDYDEKDLADNLTEIQEVT